MNKSKLILLAILFLTVQLISASDLSTYTDGAETAAVTNQVSEDEHELPTPFMVIPFVLLLAGIATGPLFYHHFWEHN
jgi:hypothetical protein